jgi:hypothetical protein
MYSELGENEIYIGQQKPNVVLDGTETLEQKNINLKVSIEITKYFN